MRKALLIAFHFPPMSGSSGLQRTLKLCRYLPDEGWLPTVLTAHPRAYPQRQDDLMGEIPDTVRVERAFALDAARHLSVAGRYPSWLGYPDRWWSWAMGAIPAGMRLIREEKPELIWSTHPVPTAQFVGMVLARWSGLPWIADIRDPMVEPGVFPESAIARRMSHWIERRVMKHARCISVTAPGTRRQISGRYPDARVELVPNGYDEENFQAAEHLAPAYQPRADQPLEIVHSGLLYSVGRDPAKLFQALAMLRDETGLGPEELRLRLRATGNDRSIATQLAHYGVADMVSLEPPLPYVQALAEMLTADGLLLVQDSSCNDQIPAKLYEYLRAGRPILALTDPVGDTAGALTEAGGGIIARLDDAFSIRDALTRWLPALRDGTAQRANEEISRTFSRQAMTSRLAVLFEAAVARSTAS